MKEWRSIKHPPDHVPSLCHVERSAAIPCAPQENLKRGVETPRRWVQNPCRFREFARCRRGRTCLSWATASTTNFPVSGETTTLWKPNLQRQTLGESRSRSRQCPGQAIGRIPCIDISSVSILGVFRLRACPHRGCRISPGAALNMTDGKG